jgi:hypothetical protein
MRPAWDMMQSDRWEKGLAATGVGDIDFVMCTHLHVDHVGWNTRLENGRWVPTFPKARYLFSKTELDYWLAENDKAELPPIADSVIPIVEAKRCDLITSDHAVDDTVVLLPDEDGNVGAVFVTTAEGAQKPSGDQKSFPQKGHRPSGQGQQPTPDPNATQQQQPGGGRGDMQLAWGRPVDRLYNHLRFSGESECAWIEGLGDQGRTAHPQKISGAFCA